MKVLHVSQPVTEGVAVCVAALVRSQVAAGLTVEVACPGESFLAREIVEAGATHRPWHATRPPGPGLVREVATLRSALRLARPDLVHLHSSKAGLAGRLALRGRVTTVFQPHAWSFAAASGRLSWASLRWERYGARWTQALVCVSEAERAQGAAAGIRAPWHVIPNGIDLERFQPLDDEARARQRRALGLGSEPTAVCIARLSRQKGQDVLLGAWPAVTAALPGARLVLVGDGPERERLQHSPPAGVRFEPTAADVRPWLAAADVVVAPSRWEGMSLGLLEAMASHRCVVATDVPGAREALGPDASLVPVEDAAALAAALLERLDDPARRAAEAAAAQARAVELFGVERMAAAFLALYTELVT